MKLTTDQRGAVERAIQWNRDFLTDCGHLHTEREYCSMCAESRQDIRLFTALLAESCAPLDVSAQLVNGPECWPGDPDEQVAA